MTITPISYYHDILDMREHDYQQYRLRVEAIASVRNRPNPESILMTYGEYIEFKKSNKYVVDVKV